MSLQDLGYREQLSRVLTTRDLVIYGLVFMVPIAPFAVFGFVWQDAKGMVPLAYLLGLAGMFFTALSYAAMSRAFPVAGCGLRVRTARNACTRSPASSPAG